ncbi:MAG: GTP cyclohydrolase II [Pseudomonadota bacterium]
MALSPQPEEEIARARNELRMGVPIAFEAGGETVLVAAVETLRPDRWEAFQALDAPVLAVTARRAETLRARAYDGDLARIAVPEGTPVVWLQSVADPAADLASPMKGPFETLRGGKARVERAALVLARRALLLPAVVTTSVDAAPAGVQVFDLERVEALISSWSAFTQVSSARVPTALAGAGRVTVFRSADGAEEHYAVEVGMPDRAVPVLSRLHSACFTGDVLGSLKCDCGPQLHAALEAIAKTGAGVLLYLNQEGRGIGLANKMRAYALQDQGFDTVEANHRLGFEDDERNLRVGAELLRVMGISSVRLMTNNPRKVEMMRAGGVDVVERVPLSVGQTAENRAYLATKRDRSGHLL